MVAVGQLLGLNLGLAMQVHLSDKLAVVAPAEQNQRNIEQQGADHQIVRANAAALHRLDDLLQRLATGADEQDDRGRRNAERNGVARAVARSAAHIPGRFRPPVNFTGQLAMPPFVEALLMQEEIKTIG